MTRYLLKCNISKFRDEASIRKLIDNAVTAPDTDFRRQTTAVQSERWKGFILEMNFGFPRFLWSMFKDVIRKLTLSLFPPSPTS